jgi:putative phosphoesterase
MEPSKMIAVISDTHDNVESIRKTVKILMRKNPEFVIHLGDVVAPFTILEFKGLKMKFILGNCDSDSQARLDRAQQIGAEQLADFAEIDWNEIGRASCREECKPECRSRWSPYH